MPPMFFGGEIAWLIILAVLDVLLIGANVFFFVMHLKGKKKETIVFHITLQ